MAKRGKGMLFSVEQAFVGRDEMRGPLKAPAWEARVDRLNMTHKLVIVKKRDPRVTFFLHFFPSLRLCSARRILKSD